MAPKENSKSKDTNIPNNQSKRNGGGGVADYFAILGIGDTLELKSTQKKYQRVLSATTEDNEEERMRQKEALLQEEECALIERFYREIVEVSIFTAYSDTNGLFVGGSLATSISANGDEEDGYDEDNDCYYQQNGYFNNMYDHNEKGYVSKSRYQFSSIVPSPSNLAFRKTMNQDDQNRDQQHDQHLSQGQILPKEISGFEIVYQTIASSSNNIATNHQPLSINPNASGLSYGTDNDLSMNASLPLNNSTCTFDTMDATQIMSQPLNTDLNPKTGLFAIVNGANGDGGDIKISQDLSFQNLSFDSTSYQSQQQQLQSDPKQQHDTWSRLNFTRGITKKLIQQQLSPIISTKSKAIVGESYKKNTNANQLTKHFYIGYRRRGADETNKPGVADLLLMYCKIHKDTVIDAKVNRNFESAMKTCEGSASPNQGEDHSQSRMNHDLEESATTSGLAPMTTSVLRKGLVTGASIAKRVAASGKNRIMRGRSKDKIENELEVEIEIEEDSDEDKKLNDNEQHIEEGNFDGDHFEDNDKNDDDEYENYSYETIYLHEVLQLPEGFENGEWIIPCAYQCIKLPLPKQKDSSFLSSSFDSKSQQQHPPITQSHSDKERINAERRTRKTYLFNHLSSPTFGEGSGVEAYVQNDFHSKPISNVGESDDEMIRRNPWSPDDKQKNNFSFDSSNDLDISQRLEDMLPSIVRYENLASMIPNIGDDYDEYEYIPIIAVRRQRIGEEERFQEDSAVTDVTITLSSSNGDTLFPEEEEFDEFEANYDDEEDILGKSKWLSSFGLEYITKQRNDNGDAVFMLPSISFRRNLPRGFVDTPFAAGVLDRFPKKDYKGVPLPEEELPMFCYPTGCRLFRARYQDAPLAEYYGFVVKNERGDNIHVSCVSFMEPLETSKTDQLDQLSSKLKKTSLAHKRFCDRRDNANHGGSHLNDDKSSFLFGFEENDKNGQHVRADMVLTGFDEMMTFELKTICLVSRYPFWSAFRRFLSHLHILSGSSSDLPLERYISHLLLDVTLPKPGGQCILVPLPAIAIPCVLHLPPVKDMPLLDLPCHRLFACLDAPTVVTIVLGFLALERKVIVMSTFPSLVSDVCEILRSLLFPFELCAPYVPRLTSPFMSCLQFPGAIFVGIHDDGFEDGLAASVRNNIPEDTFIVDLDTGDIDCNGDRYEKLKECWDIIPTELRSLLVEEIETLCQDARIIPGQEPLGAEIEAALDVSVSPTFGDNEDDLLDDRAIRDCFLRFFCSILGGYERFLVLPDMDFLISGAEWFDSKGFLNATKTQSRSAFLNSFVSTQLFQSFIQRRTEASDVRCLLFDECLTEFHSSKVPYGRLSRYGETSGYMKGKRYDLLVDQCAADVYDCVVEGDEISSAEVSILTAHTLDGTTMINSSGDIVTAPSRKNLPIGTRYVYCIDGHPHFPQKLDAEMFYPTEPESLSANIDEQSVPILTRSDREIDVSKIRRKLAVTQRGVQRQRRCLFQLPKVMGSHFLNTWLMCIPSQVSQKLRSSEQQQNYILRALGALRRLRSRQRIVPDEAGYRCMMVACGRADSDRRQELVKLFGLLRSDGIFPSAVTLGQYTRAIAEGFSKRSCGKTTSSIIDMCSTYEMELIGAMDFLDSAHPFDFLDGSLVELEESGKRWRSSRDKIDGDYTYTKDKRNHKHDASSNKASSQNETKSRKRKHHTPWSPVMCSSSFSPHWKLSRPPDESFDVVNDFSFIAMWSRTTKCDSCSYTLLDEEIQAGWDDINTDIENNDEIRCPCCGKMLQPRLGYNEVIIDKYPPHSPKACRNENTSTSQPEDDLPSQLQPLNVDDEDGSNYVPYLSPSRMRQLLEEIVEENGEEVLERKTLRYLSPIVFFNLWWFCARFSLPLPLAIAPKSIDDTDSSTYSCHCCVFAAWDKSLALAGCRSGVKAVRATQGFIRKRSRPQAAPSFQDLVKSFDVPSSESGVNGETSIGQSILSEAFPFLSFLNLQILSQSDWDNTDLSAILVPLVEACDKRDFLPVLKAVLQCNVNRRSRLGRKPGSELHCYQTLMYLTRYQCTTVFNQFFPTTCKVCKGYHFWCPNTTVTIFDRMFREAVDSLQAQGNDEPLLDVSDVALGFRSVFGHII